MAENALWLLLAIPMAIGILNLILPVILRKILTLLGVLAALWLIYLLYGAPITTVEILGQPALFTDKLGLLTLAFIQLLSLLILVFSLKGVSKDIEKQFFVLYPLTIGICNGVVVSQHIFSFLIFWGLSGVALYLFALLGQTERSSQTAKKTFIIVGGSDAFLMLGLVVLGLTIPQSNWLLGDYHAPLSDGVMILAFVCLLIASFAKAGGFPLHTWVPDFSEDASVESAAFLPASLDKLLGIYLLARMMLSWFSVELVVHMIIISLGAITVITAVMMAMIQHNGRRLLGYHAVSQVGYMIMGVGSGSLLAIAGGLFHMVNHTIYKSNLFLSLGSVEKRTGTSNLDELGGLARMMPATFLMALIGALSISGIPPFNGFFSKWMIYQGLVEQAAAVSDGYQLWLLACLVLAVFGSALTLASFIKFLHAVYLGKQLEKWSHIREAPFNQWLGAGALALLCVGFGLFALELPLRQFIYPIFPEMGLAIPEFLGMYSPKMLFILFGLAFLTGFVIYLATRNIRYDEIYIGGMSPSEKFRIIGTEFYNEIRNMPPLRPVYNSAEKRYFDLYEMGTKSTFGFSHLLQRGHPGVLPVYLLYILLGFLVLLWIVV